MSMALVELTQRRSLVGTSHLATSLLITALLGFGIDVGDAVADGVGLRTQAGASPSGACSHPVPPPAQWAALLPTSAALCVQMGATLRQAPWLVGVAYACIAASQGLRARPAARKLSTLVGALVAGWLANAHANATGKPALAAAAMGVRWRVARGVTQHASNCLQSINLACASLQVMILIPDGLANLSGLGRAVRPLFRDSADGLRRAGVRRHRRRAVRGHAAAAAGGREGGGARGGARARPAPRLVAGRATALGHTRAVEGAGGVRAIARRRHVFLDCNVTRAVFHPLTTFQTRPFQPGGVRGVSILGAATATNTRLTFFFF